MDEILIVTYWEWSFIALKETNKFLTLTFYNIFKLLDTKKEKHFQKIQKDKG